MLKQRPSAYALVLVALSLYIFLGYFVKRQETFSLFLGYAVLFALYIYVVAKSTEHQVNFWLTVSVLFRASLLFSIPALSDDVYRFIWDGRLWALGYHPFAEAPSFYVGADFIVPAIDKELFKLLNSPEYFTVYPPLAQLVFWVSAMLSPHAINESILVLKVMLFAAEVGSLLLIKSLLQRFAFPASRLLLYCLNPLIILELVGNVHLEALMIFMLLSSLYFLFRKMLLLSAFFFSLAISTKLIPLIFLPAIMMYLGRKKGLLYGLIVGVAVGMTFLPLWNEVVFYGLQNSLPYYFQKFEFNASLYYLIRMVGYWIVGFNIIYVAGWVLALLNFMIIIYLSVRLLTNSTAYDKGRLWITLTLVMTSYFLFVTTLHPWYIATLLVMSVFTTFRFVILWTALIFLTYGGYSSTGYQENLWFTAIEYCLVLGYLAYEWRWQRKHTISLES